MKKCYIAAVLLTSVFAFTACNKETAEPVVEDVVTEDSQKETVDPVEDLEANEADTNEENQATENLTWAEQNNIVFAEPKELTGKYYCYLPLNGEKLDDVQNQDNKAVISKPEVTVEENGDMKTYSITYTAVLSNKYVVPDSYKETDSWKGNFHDYQVVDPYTGTVIPFLYDGNEYEVAIPQGDDTCKITTSSSFNHENGTQEALTGEDQDYKVWYWVTEDHYSFNLKITVPKDNDDIGLYINITDSYSDDPEYKTTPHTWGDNYDEVKEDCVFIKLSDLVK